MPVRFQYLTTCTAWKRGEKKRTKRSSCCTMHWGKPNKPPALPNYLQSLLFFFAPNWELGMKTWGLALTLPCITHLHKVITSWGLLTRKHFSSTQVSLALNFGFFRHTLNLQHILCTADILLQHTVLSVPITIF